MKSDNGTGDKTIDYTLKAAANEGGLADAGDLTDGGTVLEVKAGTESGSASIKGEVSGNPATGEDTYSDTLNFSVTCSCRRQRSFACGSSRLPAPCTRFEKTEEAARTKDALFL